MTENEFILQDRLAKTQAVLGKYGASNFYVSFSGGKDSMVLHHLIDMAEPENRIPRVYADTGIEYKKMVEYVTELQKHDDRIQIIKPKIPIRQMLEREGYPFKSKMHSNYVKKYQSKGMEYKSVRAYTGKEDTLSGRPMFRPCPKVLLYQFSKENKLKISDMCCYRLKEQPIKEWQKEHNKKYSILGLMREEGGRRHNAGCMAFKSGKLTAFQPLAVLTKEWENWFIDKYNIKLCDLYYPPYNFTRTGCKGCPFALHLQDDLNTLRELLPNEAAQCERIWAPVYAEYRRIGYRLKENTPG